SGNLNSKMISLIKQLKERKQFIEATLKTREEDSQRALQQDGGIPPVFNKRFFSSKGAAVVTPEARRIMAENRKRITSDKVAPLSKSEMSAMRCVVDGLRMIHRDVDYVKDCVTHCLTYEKLPPFTYVTCMQHETCLSCFYLICGVVEVTYDASCDSGVSVHEPNIIYTHSTGEYLGLISAKEGVPDLAPPSSVYTKQPCECLRIDRIKFHKLLLKRREQDCIEKMEFLNSNNCILNVLSADEKQALLQSLRKIEIPANKLVVKQGEISEYIYFIINGRCQRYRRVKITEFKEQILFELDTLEAGGCFAEECVLNSSPSECSIITKQPTTLYQLNRSEFELKDRTHLIDIVRSKINTIPDDVILKGHGYDETRWRRFKQQQVKSAILNNHSYIATRQQNINIPRIFLGKRRIESAKASCSSTAHMLAELTSPSTRSRSSLEFITTATTDTSEKIEHLAHIPASIRNDGDRRKLFIEIVKQYNKIQRNKNLPCEREEQRHLTENTHKCGPEVDARDIHNRFKADRLSIARARWKFASDSVDYNIMLLQSNNVMCSIDTGSILRNAIEGAANMAKRVQYRKDNTKPPIAWQTPIHEERDRAKQKLAFNRYRMEILRRRLRRNNDDKLPMNTTI
ncbi:uncharacterized protein LOC141909184, partial [Tubulanus polymorphus]|uniref:uncharacterized protein LOC141909184 n=1 Tax=Tubulanus polymorphus TaxID=672921 RepID=UPI003DA3B9F5